MNFVHLSGCYGTAAVCNNQNWFVPAKNYIKVLNLIGFGPWEGQKDNSKLQDPCHCLLLFYPIFDINPKRKRIPRHTHHPGRRGNHAITSISVHENLEMASRLP
ncbi:hypothetical protein NE237_025663 [Protea cynaroides]|uniref:Uncharacterized protein n=1 Tax=Protea cynaroides TaxID=273540 RepID=A0A9Q0H299_9MAGN|nr:hypothetical protein NE237_025663 [Protea cynaroides]